MTEKIIIIYDLQNKNQKEKVMITKKLYGYRDKSNYNYDYDRQGLLNQIQYKKSKKMILELTTKKDLTKITTIFKELGVDIQIAKI
jgi:NAD-dependent SIR2 family protein deacetylase